ncbi:MAG: hypothetical protein KBD63_07090 [Bacteriovoracaceae bacterium]|nr:hypothetical protein [Bacteriovoracaceae bacterium]
MGSRFFLVFFLLCSCASSQNKWREDVRTLYTAGSYEEALHILKTAQKKKQDKKSQLLYFLEEAVIKHRQGDYQTSNSLLEQAQHLYQELYTKSVSNIALSFILNDQVENYAGALFEGSQIYFYLTLNNFLLYQKEVKKNTSYLFKAKAYSLAWDSYIKSNRENRVGKAFFQDDLMAKILAGLVHEEFHTRIDDQTAYDLYAEAYRSFFKIFNAYATFNNKAQAYRENYRMIVEEKLAEGVKYIEPSLHQIKLKKMLQEKMAYLSMKLYPKDWKEIWIRDSIPIDLEKKIDMNAGYVTIITMNGVIPPKKARKINFGFAGLVEKIEDPILRESVRAIGIPVLTLFALQELGLSPPYPEENPFGFYLGFMISQYTVMDAGLKFEVPQVDNVPVINPIPFYFERENDAIKAESVVVTPLAEMLKETVQEDAAKNFIKSGVRSAGKYILAVLAAYQTYKKVSENKNENSKFLARSLALVQYLATAKIIEQTEKADIRYWSLLPESLSIMSVPLKAGTYMMKQIDEKKGEIVISPQQNSVQVIYN